MQLLKQDVKGEHVGERETLEAMNLDLRCS